ncbi:MAG: DUF3857 domain-containing protein [Deltaproteobacteria bacterium]|nr:DUF3857 domain-containing protein [Deltaproteobacteria bacterium]
MKQILCKDDGRQHKNIFDPLFGADRLEQTSEHGAGDYAQRVGKTTARCARGFALSLVTLCSLSLGLPAQAQVQPRRAPPAPPVATAPSDSSLSVEERLDLWAQEARGGLAQPAGAVPMLRMYGQRDWVEPLRLVERFRQLAETPRAPAERVALARYFEARMRRRMGQRVRAEGLERGLGLITQWSVLGPLDNEGRGGFALESPAEAQRFAALDSSQSYPGKDRPARWRMLPALSVGGLVALATPMVPEQNVCVLAHTVVTLDARSATDAMLWFGGSGQSRVYVNGVSVLRDETAREVAFFDRHGVRVRLNPGANRVLVKSCVATESLGFYARFTTTRGAPLALRVDPDSTHTVAQTVQPAPTQEPAMLGVLAALEALAAAPNARPEVLEATARWLTGTGSAPVAESIAGDLVRRAAEAAPTVARWLLVADLARSRTERIDAVQRALALVPDDLMALTAMAHLRRTGVRAEEAQPWIDRVLMLRPNDPLARIEQALLYDGVGLNLAARNELARAAVTLPHSAALMQLRMTVADHARLGDEVRSLREGLLALRADDAAIYRDIAGDCRLRGDRDGVRQAVDRMVALAPYNLGSYTVAATLLEAIQDGDGALGVLARALDIAPESADLWSARGELEVRLGRRDDARASLRRALALRPQDQELRQHMEALEPSVPRPDELLAETAESFLTRRTPERSATPEYRMRSLHELTVRTVYPNGLAGTFRQSVFEVLTPEGAQDYRQIPIGYDQSAQRFELRAARIHHRDGTVDESTGLNEYAVTGGASRMYYDTREMVVSFPRLRAGDVVEVRWRVDDVSQRNAFADYFGDLEIFQSDSPRASVRYVLRAPAERTFYFRPPVIPRLVEETRTEGALRVYDYRATDVAPVPPEANAPGLTERAAYLHVSTYRDWADVARWYWGLIAEQLRADDRVRQIAQRAVQGITEPRERVRAIYNWVIQNTRYVALEFGIHGFKPYRVTDICTRGFGDCKDKASTIVTMLREVGIDASIVLVRTRHNGDIAQTPASLAVFDHAIAYVPPMPGLPNGIFLDGTAQNSAMEELPSMDQGAMGLIVSQRGEGRLVTLPFLTPESNTVEVRSELDVLASGAGRWRASSEIRGSEASQIRSYLDAEATRIERVQRWDTPARPGSRVTEVHTGNLRNVDEPARFDYVSEMPAVGTRQGDILRFRPMASPELTSQYAERTSRSSDVMVPGPMRVHERRVIRLPAGSTVTELPAAASLRGPSVSLEYTLSHTGNTVTVERTETWHTHRVSVRDYAVFREQCQRIDDALGRRMSIRLPAVRTP